MKLAKRIIAILALVCAWYAGRTVTELLFADKTTPEVLSGIFWCGAAVGVFVSTAAASLALWTECGTAKTDRKEAADADVCFPSTDPVFWMENEREKLQRYNAQKICVCAILRDNVYYTDWFGCSTEDKTQMARILQLNAMEDMEEDT